MKEVTQYMCDVCGKLHITKGDCERCERAHVGAKRITGYNYDTKMVMPPKYPFLIEVEMTDGEILQYMHA